MADALYTRIRTTGPSLNYTSADVADSAILPGAQMFYTETQKVFRVAGLPGYRCEAIFDIPLFPEFRQGEHPYWISALRSTTYSGGKQVSSYNAATGEINRMRVKFLAVCNGKLDSYTIPSTVVNALSKVDESSIFDVPTKNFKKRFAEGEVINNPVLNRKTSMKVKWRLSGPPIKKYKTNARLYRGLLLLGGTLDPMFVDLAPPVDSVVDAMFKLHSGVEHTSFFNAKQTAINAAYGKVNKGAYAYLVELGEAKETIGYLAQVFSRIAGLVKDVKRGHWKQVAPKAYKKLKLRAKRNARLNGTSYRTEMALGVIDLASSAWMEARFAIRPLIYGAQDAIKLHQEGLNEQSGRSTQNYRCAAAGSSNTSVEAIVGDISTTTTTQVESTRKATAGVLVQIDTAVAKMRTLGFTDIGGSLWELLFLSWAADYFVNLDGLLYHLTPDIGVKPLTAWSGTDDTINIVTEVTRRRVSTGELLDNVEYSTTSNVYQREPVDAPSFITIDVNLDVAKLADLGALFYGLLRSR